LESGLLQVKTELADKKKEFKLDVIAKQREQVQATEKLRKEMQYKIKETKANLLALNDEQ
jgi:hypothetical protein